MDWWGGCKMMVSACVIQKNRYFCKMQQSELPRGPAPEFSMVNGQTINQCGRNENREEGATTAATDGELVD